MGQTNRICIIISDYQSGKTYDLLSSFERDANTYGYQTVTFSMLQSSELFTNEEEFIYQLIDFDQYDGFVLHAKSFAAHKGLLRKIEDQLKKTEKPVVTIGMSRVGEDAMINAQTATGSFETICDHLIEVHGCETIYFLGGDQYEVVKSRVAGIKSSMERHDLKWYQEWILYGGYWKEGAEKLVKDITYGYVDKPDAVICYNDEIAKFLISAMYKDGIRVPEEVIVTGYNNFFPENHLFSITTTEADHEEIGRRAFSILYGKMIGGEAPEYRKKKRLLITGMSCGCGNTKPFDIRVRLERQDKMDEKKMEYRNSYIREKLYTVQSQEELVYYLLNLSYLVPEKRSIGVFTTDEKLEDVKCIFMTDELESGTPITCKPKSIFISEEKSHNAKNTHVFPLIFNREIQGYMTAGYSDTVHENALAIEFAQHVSVAMHLLKRVQYYQEKNESTSGGEEKESHPAPLPMNYNGVLDTPEAAAIKYDQAPKNDSNYILGMNEDRTTIRINMENIYYFEGVGNEVFAVTKVNRYKIGLRLYECEGLKNMKFMRISKSVVVNLDKVVSFKLNGDRTCDAMLSNKTEVRVSRKYFDEFKTKIV